MTARETVLASLGLQSVRPVAASSPLGFALTRPGVRGQALLRTGCGGMELVKRLKDAEGALAEETAFWVRQMLPLAAGVKASVVTAPPSSGKRAHHLATDMAQMVAAELDLPYRALFVNPNPRGNRAGMVSKLREVTTYEYGEQPAGRRVLVVDDAYCTGSTALRCVRAAQGDQLWFVALSRS